MRMRRAAGSLGCEKTREMALTADGRGASVLLDVEDLAVEYAPPPVQPAGATPLARAVDGVTLSLAAGRALAMVGESGSGKTTAALALFGLLPAGARVVRGSARLDGLELLGRDQRALGTLRGTRMALVFQDAGAALHPALTIGDQVGEPLRIHQGASHPSTSTTSSGFMSFGILMSMPPLDPIRCRRW